MEKTQEVNNRKRPEPGDASLKWMALLHVVCCGGSLLLFALISAGVSLPLAFISHALPYLAIIGVLLAAGALLWFFQRRCSTCPFSPPEQRGMGVAVNKKERK